MRYLGSKVSTLSALGALVTKRIQNGSFCDPFGGIGSVGTYFCTKGFNITCGDILHFPHYMQIAKLCFRGDRFFNNLFKKGETGIRTLGTNNCTID